MDILVANAGIARSGTPAEDASDELWLNVNDVTYNGVFWCDPAFGRNMDGGVRVNAVAPTYVETDMLARLAATEPEMVGAWLRATPGGPEGAVRRGASVVRFLASDASFPMRNAIVAADGGFACW